MDRRAAGGQRGQRQRPDPAGGVGFVDGPGVATDDTLLGAFGFEGVTNCVTQASLVGDALTYLGGGTVPTAARAGR